MKSRRHQRAGDDNLNRTDHVWLPRGKQSICALCGALVNRGQEPPCPTPANWTPIRYAVLTDDERLACPPMEGVKR